MAVTLQSVLNNIWAAASYDYQNRVPKATRENLKNVQGAVMADPRLQNEYLHALAMRIAGEIYTSHKMTNPFQKFVRGTYRYGDEIEEIYVNLCTAHDYSASQAERELYKQEIPDVASAFHPVNSKIFYKQTVNEDQISSSFLTENGMRSLIALIVDAMQSSGEKDAFLQTKAIITNYKDHFLSITVPELNKANANDIVTAIKTVSTLLTFPTAKIYNQYGLENQTPKERQVLILRADAESIIDVNSLAMAFNLPYADFVAATKLNIDSFGPGMESVIAVLVDDEFFQIYEKKRKFTEQYNAQSDSWQYFLHIWMRYGCSPFSNAIAFTTEAAADPETVTVESEGKVATLEKGGGVQFTATVAPSGAVHNVSWSINGQKSSETVITATGYLAIGKDEQSTTVNVVATSTVKPSITGKKAMTVNQA